MFRPGSFGAFSWAAEMTEQVVGTARIDIVGDASTFEVAVSRAQNRLGSFSEESQQAYERLSSSAKRATSSFVRWAESAGNTAESQRFLNAAASGVPVSVLEEARQKMLEYRKALDYASASARELEEAQAFDRQHQAAQKLVASTEYVRWWEDALVQADAAEKRLAGDRAFLQALQDRANAAGKTAAEILELQAAERGLSAEAAPFIAKLKEQQGVMRATGATFDKYGISTAQYSAALRGVPAQITDIVVSLQGGQAPMTVLLQQGGQLKDMFGGIVPAAKALGSTILGLISPMTLGAGALAVLGYAAYQGFTELNELQTHLIMSGNAADVSLGQISRLADQMEQFAGVTRSGAIKVLTEIVKSGKIAGNQLEVVSEIAVRSARVLGRETADVVGEFAKLADEPAKASSELNRQYGYLTASTYLQIRALEEQGQKQEAARLAQDTYAEATRTRLSEVESSLGTLGRAWEEVWGRAKKAWDGMAGLGRPLTVQEQIAETQKALDELNNPKFAVQGPLFRDLYGGEEGVQAEASRLQQRIADLRDQLRRESGRAVYAQMLKDEQATAEARADYAKGGRSRVQLRQDELKAETDQWTKLSKGLAQGSYEYEQLYAAHLVRVKGIEDKYKDRSKDPAFSRFSDDAGQRMVQQVQERIALYEHEATAGAKALASEKELVKFEETIARLKEKDVLNKADKQVLAVEEEVRGLLQAEVSLNRQAEVRKALLALEGRSVQIAEQMAMSRDSANEQYQRELDAYGLGAKAMERVQAQREIYREFRRYQGQLTKASDMGAISSDRLKVESDKIQAELRRRLAMQKSYYDEVDRLQGSWSVGASQGLVDYADGAADVFSSVANVATQSFKGMEDAIVAFATTGKLSFSDFARSVIADLVRIAIQQSVTGPLAGWLGGMFSGATGLVSGASLPGIGGTAGGMLDGIQFSSGGYTGDGGKYEFAGAVHKGEGVLNAAEIRAIGGEAGFEALRRDIAYGRGHYSGGMAGYPSLPPASQAARPIEMPQVVVNNNGTPQRYEVQSFTEKEIRLIAEDVAMQVAPKVVAQDMRRPNSLVSKSVGGNFNTTRKR